MNRLLIIKKVKTGCIAFVLLAVLMGCSKDKKVLLNTWWKIQNIKLSKGADYSFIYNEEVTLLINDDDGEFFLTSSDFCVIFGRVKVGNSKINFKDKLNTGFICSQSMNDCADLLVDKITHYKIYGHKLALTGKNGVEINCVIKL